jgi:hypothetical protein
MIGLFFRTVSRAIEPTGYLGVAVLILVSTLLAGNASAQVDAGSIRGQVTDSSGAAVPLAEVTILNEATGTKQSVKTDGTGNYSFAPVRIGSYTISAEMPGFDRQVQEHVRVDIQQERAVALALRTGSVQQSVVVSDTTSLLQTENASVGQVLGQQQINDLPLNGRNYFFLAQLSAGVTFGQKDSRGEDSNGRFTANGVRATQNDYLLDGIDNNSSIISAQNGKDYVIQTPVDALSEFKVQTNNYNAEFGRAAGAVLNATVKSGTNKLHGDAWEFLRNDALDANDYFLNQAGLTKPEFHRNQFGVAVGGPVLVPHLYNGRNRTFFFGDYEGTRSSQGNAITGTVPTNLERNSQFTNFSDLVSLQSGNDKADALGHVYPLGTILDPASTAKTGTTYVRTPISGGTNIIAGNRIDPNAVALLNLLPAPTNSALLNNYVTDPIYEDTFHSFDIRIDQVLGKSDYLFGRYSFNYHSQNHPGIFTDYGNGYADGGNSSSQSNFTDRAQNVSIGYTHTFSPRLANDLRVGVNREHVLWLQPNGDTYGIPAQFGIQGVPQTTNNGGLPQFAVGSLTNFGSFNSLLSNKYGTTPQVNDDLTFNLGRHSIKVGYEQQRIYFPFTQPPQSRGNLTFNGEFTSVYGQTDTTTGIAQMLLLPTGPLNLAGANSVKLSNFVEHSTVRNYLGSYVQDDWKATPHVTVNMGLRYDYYGFLYDQHGQLANFVPGPNRVGGTFYVTPQLSPNIPATFATALANEGISIQTLSGSLAKVQHLNFAPRVGVSDRFTDRFVMRAGFGIFYGGIEDIGGGALPTENFPVEYTVTRTATNAATPITADNSIGLLETTFANLPLAPSTVNPAGLPIIGYQYNAATPYVEGFNLSFEYQITPTLAVSVGYDGSQGRHIVTQANSNSVGILLPAGTTTTPYLPYQQTALTGDTVSMTEGSSNYNALLVNLEQRPWHGITFLTNFALQKDLTDAREPLEGDIGSYRAPYLPGFGIGRDLALADFNVHRVFHFSGTYELPYGVGKQFGGTANRLTQAVLGGWSTNFIVTAQDGQPLTVACAVTNAAGIGCNANLVPGVSPYAGSSVAHFLNAAAFATPPPVTTIGQSDISPLGGGPTQVTGPPFRRLDMSLFKQFHFPRQTYAEFRAEVFNVTNTPNFANPTTLLYTNTASFAQIVGTRDSPNDPREIQLAVKFYF